MPVGLFGLVSTTMLGLCSAIAAVTASAVSAKSGAGPRSAVTHSV